MDTYDSQVIFKQKMLFGCVYTEVLYWMKLFVVVKSFVLLRTFLELKQIKWISNYFRLTHTHIHVWMHCLCTNSHTHEADNEKENKTINKNNTNPCLSVREWTIYLVKENQEIAVLCIQWNVLIYQNKSRKRY